MASVRLRNVRETAAIEEGMRDDGSDSSPPHHHHHAGGAMSGGSSNSSSPSRLYCEMEGGGGGGGGRQSPFVMDGNVSSSNSSVGKGFMPSWLSITGGGGGGSNKRRTPSPPSTSEDRASLLPGRRAEPSSKRKMGKRGGGVTLSKDAGSIALLLVLYTLQGIPMGLSGSIPFLLTDRVSYRHQALFSLVSLPFSFKLLWAPLVDSTSLPPWGRRKSWLVPIQTLCGLLMLAASPIIPYWMGDIPAAITTTITDHHSSPPSSTPSPPNVRALTAYFLSLYALMATQDIAVDGWALTMLSSDNVGHASTCNTIGQTLGYFLAHVGFLALNSAETCNRFLRSTPQPYGLVTLSGFMWFWGWVFLATTFLVICKEERREDDYCHDHEEEGAGGDHKKQQRSAAGGKRAKKPGGGCCAAVGGVVDTYRQLFQVLRLPAVRSTCLILLTVKVAFAVIDSATNLKLIEYGMPKEEIALMSPLLVLAGIFIPLALTTHTSGPRPLNIFLQSYLPRLGVGLLYGLLLPFCAWAYRVPGFAPTSFRLYFLLCIGLRELTANAMFVSQMAFFARVSDPRLGGTYMTLLNTVSNLGGSWVKTASLGLLDTMTMRDCRQKQQQQGGGGGGLGTPSPSPSFSLPLTLHGLPTTCSSPEGASLCRAMGGECVTVLDGYTVQLIACTVLGLLWYALMKRRILRLQETKPEDWLVGARTWRYTVPKTSFQKSDIVNTTVP